MTPSDAFTEALAMVPMVHLPVTQGQRVLIVGKDAVPAAIVALRYPTTVEVVIVDPAPPVLQDKRVRTVARMEALAPAWKADLVAVAMPVITDSLVQAVYNHHRADTGVAVFALARAQQVRASKEQLRKLWSSVQPYREQVVEAEGGAAWFLLAGDHGFKRHRPVPAWSKRLTDKYLPALFTLAKDEYVQAYGGAHG
jgi:hypothetical protein